MTGIHSGSPSASRKVVGAARSRLVLLDANALFLPIRVGFPLEAEVERHRPGAILGVPTSVLRELDRLVGRATPGAAAARALAARFRPVTAQGVGDEAVLRAAVRTGAWVVTADRALRARLAAHGVGVLAPRDRHRLEPHAPRPASAPSSRDRSLNR
jgi:rRNA-processing protein FCF1